MPRERLVTAEKASKQQTRLHNRRLVLQHIAGATETSRADIARATQLTPPTVSSLVRDLIEVGLVEERGRTDEASVGKPRQMVAIAGSQYEIACVDLSRPIFRGVITDLDGTSQEIVARDAHGLVGKDAEDAAAELVADLVERMKAPERRICLSTPGVVDDKGVVRRASYFGWTDVPLAADMQARFGISTRVVNDSHALAFAEFAELANPVDNLVAVRVARGVSAGIILHGTIYEGDGFGAGEIGFLLPTVAGDSAGKHRSALSIGQLIEHLGGDSTAPGGWDLEGTVRQSTNHAVAALASNIGEQLGHALAAVVGVLDIHTVRIDQSVACLGARLLDRAHATLRGAVVDTTAAQLDIQFGSAGPNTVLRGAAIAATHHDLGLVS